MVSARDTLSESAVALPVSTPAASGATQTPATGSSVATPLVEVVLPAQIPATARFPTRRCSVASGPSPGSPPRPRAVVPPRSSSSALRRFQQLAGVTTCPHHDCTRRCPLDGVGPDPRLRRRCHRLDREAVAAAVREAADLELVAGVSRSDPASYSSVAEALEAVAVDVLVDYTHASVGQGERAGRGRPRRRTSWSGRAGSRRRTTRRSTPPRPRAGSRRGRGRQLLAHGALCSCAA